MKKITLIIIEALIYISFMFFDEYIDSNIRFIGIVILFIYLLLEKSSKDLFILRLALLFTIISDLFLLVIDDFYIVGVLSFIIVQLLYLYRLRGFNRKNFYIPIVLCFNLILIKIILKDGFDYLLGLTVIYFTLIVNNMILSLISFKANPLFALGLVLFVCCDIFVGLYNLSSYVQVGEIVNTINTSGIDFAWGFYLPSQVLIVLSLNERKRVNLSKQ